LRFERGQHVISVKDNVNEVLRWTDRISRQYEFAVASALTSTVRAVAGVMPAAVDAAFQGGAVPFTRQGFYTVRAEKTKLTAYIGIKRLQAEYLAYQVEGGVRKPKRKALRLPGAVQLTAQGNLPSGAITKLVQRARAGKRATKALAKRVGVSSELDLFYGEPGDGRPAGIYKRVVVGPDKHQLVPVVTFPKRPAHYKPRLDFYGIAEREVRRTFKATLVQSWARAKATAR
jgi:hypothetical protein